MTRTCELFEEKHDEVTRNIKRSLNDWNCTSSINSSLDGNSLQSEVEVLRDNDNSQEQLVASPVSQNDSQSSQQNDRLERDGHLHFACTNARSIVEKIGSFITLFEESSLHFAILTETWLSKRHCPPKTLSDLTIGANLNFIRKDRGHRGGGVAVGYDPTKIKMSAFDMSKQNMIGEFVCAVGTTPLTKRKLAVLAVYLPPNMNVSQVNACLEAINETVDKLKTKYSDPIILVGGDFNRKNLQTMLSAMPELTAVAAGATRNGVALDEIYTNIGNSIMQKEILQPLCKEDGTKSDHLIVAASAKLPKNKKNKSSTFSFRPLTTKGTEKFRSLLVNTDWDQVKLSNSSDSALKLTEILNSYVEECFPIQTRKTKTNDAAWFNQRFRKLANKKARTYKKEGKSERYKAISAAYNEEIKKAKKGFLDKIIEKCKKDRNTKSYYRTIKTFQTKEAPILWEIFSLFPGKSKFEIAEEVATFFNTISQEYPPLPDPTRANDQQPIIIQEYEVAARLKSFKKPNSQVFGDINPSLVTQCADLLAHPLAYIYNQTLGTLSWPKIWKSETVTVIPKNPAPSGLSELRNLSCTPLYSKVLESFILERLKSETKLSQRQYRGDQGEQHGAFPDRDLEQRVEQLGRKRRSS